jgi:hypothetical protein
MADFDCTLSRSRVPRLQQNDPKEGRSGSLRDVRPIFELCMVGIVRRQSGSSSGILAGRARPCLTLVKTEFCCEMSAPLGWREPRGGGAGSKLPKSVHTVGQTGHACRWGERVGRCRGGGSDHPLVAFSPSTPAGER